jgi:hypothetical protein
MPGEPAEIRAWAEKHRASWDITRLVEMHHGTPVQVGFTLNLYAQLPTEIPPSSERRAAAIAIWDQLRSIADLLVEREPKGTEIEINPYDAEERFRRETGFKPEVSLEARIIHEKDYFQPLDDRDRLRSLEERLRELGLRPGHW